MSLVTMKNFRRSLAPAVLITALAALFFAATANAETRSGGTTSPADAAIPAEADVLGAAATYDSTTGVVSFTVTTAAEPQEEVGGEENKLLLIAGLGTLREGTCNPESMGPPVAEFFAPYGVPLAYLLAAENEGENPFEGPPPYASKVVTGTKTFLVGATAKTVGKAYDCAAVYVIEEGLGGEAIDQLSFPIAAPAASAAPTPAPVTTPAPAALSLGKVKTAGAKTGKWTKAKLTVTDTGGTAVGPVALKVKAPNGVVVRPGTTQVPALLPGQSWTVTVQLKPTSKAKAKSTISLTTSSGSLSAAGSFVLKRLGD
jgi:hypothetical protein